MTGLSASSLEKISKDTNEISSLLGLSGHKYLVFEKLHKVWGEWPTRGKLMADSVRVLPVALSGAEDIPLRGHLTIVSICHFDTCMRFSNRR